MKLFRTLIGGRRRRRDRDHSRDRRRHFGRRRDLPLSDLRQMGRRLQEGDRHRAELPVDRLRRRHQADPGQDRDVRRHRHAAERRASSRSTGSSSSRWCMGGIVPVVNVEGIKPGELVLDGPTLAKIFLGEIKTWDDPAIAEAQSERQAAVAGDRRRAPLGRIGHDLQLHLLSVEGEPDWKSKVGANTSVEWPVGIGAKGNEGVANNVAQTKGSIGYVEYAYAKQNKLTHAKMINKDGKAVAPDVGDRSRPRPPMPTGSRQPGFGVILTEPARRRRPGRSRRATFILIHKQPQDRRRGARGAQVLRLGLRQGRQDGRGPRLRPDARQRRQRRSRRCGRPRSRTRAASRCSRCRTESTADGKAPSGAFSLCSSEQ